MSFQIVTDIATKLNAALTGVKIISNPIEAENLGSITKMVAVTVAGATYHKSGSGFSKQYQIALQVLAVGADTQGVCQDLVDSVMSAVKEFQINNTDAGIAFNFKQDAEKPYTEALINFNSCK